MFGILGGGFGLYGYLPAIARYSGERVCLPLRYRERLLLRGELMHLDGLVQWAQDEIELLERVDGVCIAVRPADQVGFVERCLAKKNIRKLILEKPLAPNPADSMRLLHQLAYSGREFRIAYLFRFTSWGRRLIDDLGKEGAECCPIRLRWEFCAHHYQNEVDTWKRQSSEGGGVIRFYGIHLIALLAELGYSEVIRSDIAGISRDDHAVWRATFIGKKLPRFEVLIDTRARRSLFSVIFDERAPVSFISENPFEDFPPGQSVGLDRRVPILESLVGDLFQGSEDIGHTYLSVQKLWQEVESKSKWNFIDSSDLKVV